MIAIQADSADEAWTAAAGQVVSRGERVEGTRSGDTYEALGVAIEIQDPRQRWVSSRVPAINPAFAIVEALWILWGRNDARLPTQFNSGLVTYVGEGETLYGAYGDRLRRRWPVDQLGRAAEILAAEPFSRQVVLQIWDPISDLPEANGLPRSRDIPCNLLGMAKVRDGKLCWTQIMRSNDVFRGLPYNIVQFTVMQEVLAGWLGVALGTYCHWSDSLHLYEADRPVMAVGTALEARSDLDLAIPRAACLEAWGILEPLVDSALATEGSVGEFFLRAEDAPLAAGYRSLLGIVGAEVARRRRASEYSDKFLSLCEDPVLAGLWERWCSRMGKADPK